MLPLYKLWWLKTKARIRYTFRKPTSAIITILALGFYGFLFGVMLTTDKNPLTQLNVVDLHMAILANIALSAIIIFAMLVQKRKALLYADDCFYLFTGPYRLVDVFHFTSIQNGLGSLMFGAVGVFIMVSVGAGLPFTIPFLVLSFVLGCVNYFFWLILVDYLYLLSISDDKYKKAGKIILAVIIVYVLAVFTISLSQNNFDMKSAMFSFMESPLFHLIPVLGWMKLALVSLAGGDIMMCIAGVALMLGATAIVFYLFTHCKGDYVETIMNDSEEVTKYVKDVKSGKSDAAMFDTKVKNAKVNFKSGAWAIFSKNLLLMKKTNNFISKRDLIVLAIYFGVSYLAGNDAFGFYLFVYMIVIWLFSLLQESDIVKELKNYQVYLIPANPLTKLFATILPVIIKITVILVVSLGISGVIFQVKFMDILQYIITLEGYAFVFVSATVLSMRILRSRNNAMVENLLRMAILILCSVPSILLIIYVVYHNFDNPSLLNYVSSLSLVMNFVMAFIILYLCKGMMNGREISSD